MQNNTSLFQCWTGMWEKDREGPFRSISLTQRGVTPPHFTSLFHNCFLKHTGTSGTDSANSALSK